MDRIDWQALADVKEDSDEAGQIEAVQMIVAAFLEQARATQPDTEVDHNHTTITAMMGDFVGVKDMHMGGTQRLAVRIKGTEGGTGIGSAYLTEAECVAVARALLPGYTIAKH